MLRRLVIRFLIDLAQLFQLAGSECALAAHRLKYRGR